MDIAISPVGSLFWDPLLDGVPEDRAVPQPLEHALKLAAGDGSSETSAIGYWRDFARLYLNRFCQSPAGATATPAPGSGELGTLVLESPPMKGVEFLSPAALTELWGQMDSLFRAVLAPGAGGAEAFFKQAGSPWHMVGRVTFHLAENKRDPQRPFAFLATYASGLSAVARVQHLPLGKAVEEYAGAKNKEMLLKLLQPVHDASSRSALIRELVDSRAIYQPQAWGVDQAYRFLKEVPLMEQSGVLVRMPDWWRTGAAPRATVQVTIDATKKEKGMSLNAMMDFDVALTVGGETITREEWASIANTAQGLVFLKGSWVEVDKAKLNEVLAHWEKIKKTGNGINFLHGMRMLSGSAISKNDRQLAGEDTAEWSRVEAGPRLESLLAQMRDPKEQIREIAGLKAELRPYQKKGVAWLWFMHRLGLGACLADDMGLGKTVQVIALLLHARAETPKAGASLLVAPASLLGNWQAEVARFAPSLKLHVVHPSNPVGIAEDKVPADADLVLSTYGMLLRAEWLRARRWRVAVLDEAQAIKNAGSQQSRAAKGLHATTRIALTGTPVENSLGDLWSLFDFIAPGVLGTDKEFSDFAKRLSGEKQHFAPLRRLTQPYILRRLKTDPTVITDLPAKTELKAYCTLSKKQAVLYAQAVEDLKQILENADGMHRRGAIFAFLMRFKQICNHPDHWTGGGLFAKSESGKFARLEELVSHIALRQEKVLVFTQFREMVQPLHTLLKGLFKRDGLTLDGQTAVKQRKKLVDDFQAPDGAPFFVLSLKAGGVGLNLTQASHVIHFDRWWNPAVENQATDRAFRIGQKKNVLVHKFICQGTIESRIDSMIESKKEIAEGVLENGPEKMLTEMSDAQVLDFVALDIKQATGE